MYDWFKEIGAGCELQDCDLCELLDSGFVVVPGSLGNDRLAELSRAYDLACARALTPDLSIASENTRAHDFVNRGVDFDDLYVYRPVLEACCRVIAEPRGPIGRLDYYRRPWRELAHSRSICLRSKKVVFSGLWRCYLSQRPTKTKAPFWIPPIAHFR